MRFLVVSLVAFGVSLLLLTLFVEAAGIGKGPAQALAVATSMPPNLLGTTPSRSPARRSFVQEMVIYGVGFDMVGKQPIVLLKTVDGNKFLPIWIGHPEAASILMKLQGAGTPRPMTHDLLSAILGGLEVKCTQVAVTELRENTFFASITLSVAGGGMEIGSRAGGTAPPPPGPAGE